MNEFKTPEGDELSVYRLPDSFKPRDLDVQITIRDGETRDCGQFFCNAKTAVAVALAILAEADQALAAEAASIEQVERQRDEAIRACRVVIPSLRRHESLGTSDFLLIVNTLQAAIDAAKTNTPPA